MKTEEIKIQITIPDGKKLVGTKVENGVITPVFEDEQIFRKGDIVKHEGEVLYMISCDNWRGNNDRLSWSAKVENGVFITNMTDIYICKEEYELATPEVRDTFFRVAKKAGYEYSDNKGWYKKNTLSKTWEEWVEKNEGKSVFYIYDDSDIESGEIDRGHPEVWRNSLPSKEMAKAFLALMQLINLRDEYRQGWVPAWRTSEDKYNILYWTDGIRVDWGNNKQEILSFQSAEIRDKFLENFRDLIEQAKELI